MFVIQYYTAVMNTSKYVLLSRQIFSQFLNMAVFLYKSKKSLLAMGNLYETACL